MEAKRDEELLAGLDAWRHRWRGRRVRRGFRLATYAERAQGISRRVDELAGGGADEFANRLSEARRALLNRRGATAAAVDEALAVLVRAMMQQTNRRPYEVQIMGALAMQEGWLIEMATGEGKTLTAALGAALWAWRWRRCHVVTANDYLAQRDATELQGFYRAVGLDCGHVVGAMSPDERRPNYRCAITYTTGQQILADYLRDALEFSFAAGSNGERIAQLEDATVARRRLVPPLRAAIIDEADSVLADDAVTPLIISRAQDDEELKEASRQAFVLSGQLQVGVDYSIEEGRHSVVLHEPAQRLIEEKRDAFPPTWRAIYRVAFLLTKSLVARHLYRRDQNYVVVEGKVVIVDEKTGRLLPDTTWSDGLHQAVEAKEGLELTNPTTASVKMTCQTFFRGYPQLGGMSGTLADIAGEFWRIYELPMARIPTRLPRQHRRYPDRLYRSMSKQRAAVVREIQSQVQTGRPVLVGTRSIRDSRELSAELEARGIEHVVLNALEHEQEAAIVERAGEAGRVSVATNMAGRGTDIRLSAAALDAGGLHVIGTERHDSRRVDAQLIGRSSRQGEPGSSIFLLSLEDSLWREFLPEKWLLRAARVLNWPMGERLLLGLYRVRQWRLEQRMSSIRVQLLQHEQRLQKALSFANWR